MRITTWNVNGIRAAIRKDLGRFLTALAPDVLLLQEVRAMPDQLAPDWADPAGWNTQWHPARTPGYSGVAVWSRHPIVRLGTGMDDPDEEGRILDVRTAGLRVASVYLPSGSSGDHRQRSKEAWMERFLPWAAEVAASSEPTILGGDMNIAHTERDIHNPVGNARNSGFLPHERAWFGELLGRGWTDLVRRDRGDVQGPYSWWSNRGQARALDRGWRIDYLLANAAAASLCLATHTTREGGLTVSDHAPVSADLRTA